MNARTYRQRRWFTVIVVVVLAVQARTLLREVRLGWQDDGLSGALGSIAPIGWVVFAVIAAGLAFFTFGPRPWVRIDEQRITASRYGRRTQSMAIADIIVAAPVAIIHRVSGRSRVSHLVMVIGTDGEDLQKIRTDEIRPREIGGVIDHLLEARPGLRYMFVPRRWMPAGMMDDLRQVVPEWLDKAALAEV